jgi:hypothetical protein
VWGLGAKVLLSAEFTAELGVWWVSCTVWGVVHNVQRCVNCAVGARFGCPDVVFNLVDVCCTLSSGLFPSVCRLNASVLEHCVFRLQRGVGVKVKQVLCSETACELQTLGNNRRKLTAFKTWQKF